MKRSSISPKVRFEVFKRDGFRCVYCGSPPSELSPLEADHAVSVFCGGTDSIDNLVTACWWCNRGKGAAPLSNVPDGVVIPTAEWFMEAFGDSDISSYRFRAIQMFMGLLDWREVLWAMYLACERKLSRDAVFSSFCGHCWAGLRRGGSVA